MNTGKVDCPTFTEQKSRRWEKYHTTWQHLQMIIQIVEKSISSIMSVCSIVLALELDSLGNTECKIACQHTHHKLHRINSTLQCELGWTAIHN